MISGKQIRAARALLNLKQSELSAMANISPAALTAIEQEYSAPRVSTLQRIQTELIMRGIKFTQGNGVALQDDLFVMNVFEGKDAFKTYMHDIIDCLKNQEGMAYHSHIEEISHIRRERDIFYHYYKQMEEYNLKEKLLICEGVHQVYGAYPMAEYRWIKKDYFNQVGFSVYGDKYAILFPNEKQRIVVIQNKELATTFKKQFDQNWEHSLKPNLKPALYLDDKQRFEKPAKI